MSNDFEQRLVRLESLVSMQDQTIEDLNQVVIEQQKQLAKLQYELESAQEALANGGGDSSYANQRPPHY